MVDKAEEVGAGVLGIGKQLCQLDLLVAILTNQKHLIIDADIGDIRYIDKPWSILSDRIGAFCPFIMTKPPLPGKSSG